MLNQYIQELEQDPFDGEEFVERLAWRVNASISPPGSTEIAFNPDLLHDAFTQAIKKPSRASKTWIVTSTAWPQKSCTWATSWRVSTLHGQELLKPSDS